MIHAVLIALLTAPPKPGLAVPAQVVRMVDGDTAVVEVRVCVHVRLLDCWAPETRSKDPTEKARGQADRTLAEQLLAEEGRSVTLLVPLPADGNLGKAITMSRILGYIYLKSGRELGAAIVERGHATKTKGGP
jgi:endonuclease YncB( thermonuclease family)